MTATPTHQALQPEFRLLVLLVSIGFFMQALDTTVAILQCALGAYICWSLDTTVCGSNFSRASVDLPDPDDPITRTRCIGPVQGSVEHGLAPAHRGKKY